MRTSNVYYTKHMKCILRTEVYEVNEVIKIFLFIKTGMKNVKKYVLK